MANSVDHYELTNKKAVVVSDTPAGVAIASAYTEAGAVVSMAANANGVEAAIERLDGIDILSSAPDKFLAKPITEIGDDELASVFATNFTTHFTAIRTASRHMSSGGRIVLITHVLGERGLPNCSAYCAAQGATQNLIRALAQEFAPREISINGIALGWMDWMEDRLDPTDEEAGRAIRFTISKRAGKPEDIGPMAVWLSGTGAGFVTGQIYAVDGGLLQHL
ncbi:MAG: SDR family oxidoreductase [Gammaproteobacteria bacterium]|nr:SDR family oxidoreductase [Gammaproteobacteria bacterium]